MVYVITLFSVSLFFSQLEENLETSNKSKQVVFFYFGFVCLVVSQLAKNIQSDNLTEYQIDPMEI